MEHIPAETLADRAGRIAASVATGLFAELSEAISRPIVTHAEDLNDLATPVDLLLIADHVQCVIMYGRVGVEFRLPRRSGRGTRNLIVWIDSNGLDVTSVLARCLLADFRAIMARRTDRGFTCTMDTVAASAGHDGQEFDRALAIVH